MKPNTSPTSLFNAIAVLLILSVAAYAADNQFDRFSEAADGLKSISPYPPKDQWTSKKFEWIRRASPATRGKIGELLVEKLSQANGLEVTRSPDTSADRIIEGKRVEIKMSTLWAKGIYVFQQIHNRNYDYLLCLGISPETAHAWIIPRSKIPFDQSKTHSDQSVDWLEPQVTGEDGTVVTWWIKIDPANPPPGITQFGGTLEHVAQVLRSFKAEQ